MVPSLLEDPVSLLSLLLAAIISLYEFLHLSKVKDLNFYIRIIVGVLGLILLFV